MVFNSAQRKNTGQGACWWLNFAQIERLRDFLPGRTCWNVKYSVLVYFENGRIV